MLFLDLGRVDPIVAVVDLNADLIFKCNCTTKPKWTFNLDVLFPSNVGFYNLDYSKSYYLTITNSTHENGGDYICEGLDENRMKFKSLGQLKFISELCLCYKLIISPLYGLFQAFN